MTAKPRKQSKPIYLRWRRINGRLVAVSADAVAANEIEARGYRDGDLVRAELTQPRHQPSHNHAHIVGNFAIQNLPGFEQFAGDWHAALKRLQEDARACCDVTVMQLPEIGRMEFVKARSMAFDKMDQAEFMGMMRTIYQHIADKHYQSMTAAQIAELIELQSADQMAA